MRRFHLLGAIVACCFALVAGPAFAADVSTHLGHFSNFDGSAVNMMLGAMLGSVALVGKYAERITAYEAKRAALQGSMTAIMDAADAKGETLDAAQQEEFDEFGEQIKAVDAQLDRYRTLENLEKSFSEKPLTPIIGVTTEKAGSELRGGTVHVKRQEKLEPGIAFARLIKSLGAAKGDMGRAVRIAADRYGEDSDAVGVLKALDLRGTDQLAFAGFEAAQKANVLAGSTISATAMADLVLTEGGSFADFANYLRPMTIIGKFGTGNIPSLRQVPFNTALGIQTLAGNGYWVGEGKPKPLTAFNVDKTNLGPLKCANIVVLTEELLRNASYSAETLVRDEMVAALIQLIDGDFIDPANAGSAGVKPASISNGAPHGAGSGTGDADDIRADIRSLVNEFIAANAEGTAIVLVMRTTDALAASMLVNALGQAEFPNLGMNGGSIAGLPVITSQSVPSGTVVAVQPSEIYFADDGGFMVDVSREASLQMLDNPTNDSVTPTATSLVSLWQTNSVGFRAERILNWKRRRASAVTYLTGVAWGGAVNDLS